VFIEAVRMSKEEAIKYFGGAPALAKALGIERQAVYQWDKVPEKQQLRLEKITNGDLRADPEITEAA
jgi:hypothetical protein